jgi:hypothetical protein
MCIPSELSCGSFFYLSFGESCKVALYQRVSSDLMQTRPCGAMLAI